MSHSALGHENTTLWLLSGVCLPSSPATVSNPFHVNFKSTQETDLPRGVMGKEGAK